MVTNDDFVTIYHAAKRVVERAYYDCSVQVPLSDFEGLVSVLHAMNPCYLEAIRNACQPLSDIEEFCRGE